MVLVTLQLLMTGICNTILAFLQITYRCGQLPLVVDTSGLSVAVKTKWNVMFDYYDVNNDGKMTVADFNVVDSNLAAANFKDAAKRRDLKAHLVLSLEMMGGSLTKEQYRQSLAPMYHDQSMHSLNSWFFDTLFDHLATNGFIDNTTYATYKAAYGMNSTTSGRAFRAIDTIDTDNKLTKREFREAYNDYVLRWDINIGSAPLFGPDLCNTLENGPCSSTR